jgi:CRISPR-associated protein Cas1
VQHYERKSKRLPIAREFVSAAVANILRNLRYRANRDSDCSEQLRIIEAIETEIPHAQRVDELMGYEGNIRETYYRAFNAIINLQTPFEKRVRRPPDNPINAAISFGNSLMYTACLTEIYRTQLNPTISFLHEPGERRFSLSLDLAEIFKPIIVDRVLFRLFNRGQLKESKHFETEMEGCYLNESGRQLFLQAFDEQLKQTIDHRKLKRKVSYQRLIRLECYKLIKHLTGMETYQAFRAWW